jgi:hypothetical protein
MRHRRDQTFKPLALVAERRWKIPTYNISPDDRVRIKAVNEFLIL